MWLYIVVACVVGVGAIITAIYLKYPWISYDITYCKVLLKVLKKMNALKKEGILFVDLFEDQCRLTPQKTFIIFQDEDFTYEFMDRQSNQAANLFLSMGLKKGDVVALLKYNSPEFIWTYLGLHKVGIKVALLNHNLRSKSLLHSFNLSKANTLVTGGQPALVASVHEIQESLAGVKILVQGLDPEIPDGMQLWNPKFNASSDERIPKSARAGINRFTTNSYIYTSGTTGLPKAAIINFARLSKLSLAMMMGNINENDIVYTTLPLYHSAAFIGLGGTILAGATMVLREKFSASNFWEDCRKHNVTIIQYIGELCRYLTARPESDLDTKHKVRLAVGNGLRYDVWKTFETRFQIPKILEFYGATEANGAFFNINNKFGSVGRHSPLLEKVFPMRFIKYDAINEQPMRDKQGWCTKAKLGETGLLITEIRKDFEYDGYEGNKAQTDAKVLKDVFKKGDRFVNSGDLFTFDDDYFVYFADRIGDTFRWKGENVSTIEVSNVISALPWIEDANVYGVAIPGHDGRAGMASITLKSNNDEPDMKELFTNCTHQLPRYAIPLFLRIQSKMEMTSTFKQKKVELVKEGFDPANIKDILYFRDDSDKSYKPLDVTLYKKILNGSIRI